MPSEDRRRVERQAVDMAGELHLSQGRCIPVRILNLGEMGALVAVADLEDAVLEGERVVLEHPGTERPDPAGPPVHTVGSVVRVELEFADAGVLRHLAVYFDSGPPPDGYAGAS